MKFVTTSIPDVVLIEPRVFGDHRGFFMETWHARKFGDGGINVSFVQDNHSRSLQGTLRGLHYQICHPQGKLVRVVWGSVYDVAVDLRKESPTFGKWVGVTLSAKNNLMLWIPPGFAHGFYVVSEWAEVLYKCTEFYDPDFERTIRWDDSDLAISWPLIDDREPLVSGKDRKGRAFSEAEYFL
jgi:dTDP-4-dehydrorhamnose 3,5-epimerase